jgi:DNA-binding HxlR family transcriptional regulator
MAPGTSTAASAHTQQARVSAAVQAKPACCPYFHQAVELIGRRWTGAILEILMQGGSLRFSTIAAAVPDLSDRMLSDRLKELEAYALVERTVFSGPSSWPFGVS